MSLGSGQIFNKKQKLDLMHRGNYACKKTSIIASPSASSDNFYRSNPLKERTRSQRYQIIVRARGDIIEVKRRVKILREKRRETAKMLGRMGEKVRENEREREKIFTNGKD